MIFISLDFRNIDSTVSKKTKTNKYLVHFPVDLLPFEVQINHFSVFMSIQLFLKHFQIFVIVAETEFVFSMSNDDCEGKVQTFSERRTDVEYRVLSISRSNNCHDGMTLFIKFSLFQYVKSPNTTSATISWSRLYKVGWLNTVVFSTFLLSVAK